MSTMADGHKLSGDKKSIGPPPGFPVRTNNALPCIGEKIQVKDILNLC